MRRFPFRFPVFDAFSVRLAALSSALFVVLGIYLPFFPLWLKAKGLDPTQIRIVLALPMLIRIVAIPTATRLADRNDALRGVMVTTLVAAIFGFTAVGLSDG